MRQDKTQAIALRKQGKSYKQISDAIGVSKSTLSNWLSGVAWSEETKRYLSELARTAASKRMTVISHAKRDALRKEYQSQKSIATKQFRSFIRERLFVAGLMIYWGEGDRKLENGMIRVGNSDPLMIRLFYTFIKQYVPEVALKVKMYLVLYPDLNDEQCRQNWSKKVGISLDRFIKSSFIQGKHPTKRVAYGVGTIMINSRSYKEKIIQWLELIKHKNITTRV